MHVERSTRGDITVIALIGDLDAVTAAQIDTGLGDRASAPRPLLLDLSQVCSRSPLGLRPLLLLSGQARHQRQRVAFAGVPPQLHAALSATGLLDEVVVADTVDAAVQALER